MREAPVRPRGLHLLAAVAAVVAVVLGPAAGPGGSLGPACASAATAAGSVGSAGGVRAGLVVDFGPLAAEEGAPGAVQVVCTAVGQPATGFDVLDAAGYRYRLNAAGLVCALGRAGEPLHPADGCGERTEAGYRYWAYFHGSAAGWTYAAIGPYATRVDGAGTPVQGWRFVVGAGNPTDPAPRGPSDPAAICPLPPPPPTTAPVTAPPPPPTTTPVAGGGVPGGGGFVGPGGGAPAADPPAAAPSTSAAPRPSSTPVDAPVGDGAGPGDPAAPGSGSTVAPPAGTTPAATDPPVERVDSEQALVARPAADGEDGGPPLGTLVGLAALVALVAAAVLRTRTRPADAVGPPS